MRWPVPDNLSANDLLCFDRVASKLIEFLFGGVPLGQAELSFDLILNEVFELRLNLLRLSEYVPELRCERFVDRLLDPGLGLVLVRFLRVLYVPLHQAEEFLDLCLVLLVNLNSFIDLFDAHLLVGGLVIARLLVRDLPHTVVVLLHAYCGLLGLLDPDQEFLDQFAVVVLLAFVHKRLHHVDAYLAC